MDNMIAPEVKARIDKGNYEELMSLRNTYINQAYQFDSVNKKISYDQKNYEAIINVVKYIDKTLADSEDYQSFREFINLERYLLKIEEDVEDDDTAIYKLNIDILFFQTLKDNFPNEVEVGKNLQEIIDFIKELIVGISEELKKVQENAKNKVNETPKYEIPKQVNYVNNVNSHGAQRYVASKNNFTGDDTNNKQTGN